MKITVKVIEFANEYCLAALYTNEDGSYTGVLNSRCDLDECKAVLKKLVEEVEAGRLELEDTGAEEADA